MDVEVVRVFAERRPFRAFRMYLLESRHMDATHPEVIRIDDGVVLIAETTSPDDFQFVDPNCISRIQYIPPYEPRSEQAIPT